MLSPTDIRPAVEAVLRNTDNSLSSYQILDRLPTGLRDLIIVERGWPGAGSGNSYSAASLVTDAVEGLLPSMEPPYRTYIDTGNATFQVAGKTIMAGNAAIAFYRLPDQSPSSLGRSDLQTSSSLSLNADQGDVTPLRTAPKLHWFEKPGLLALWLFLFWPVFLLGMYYNGKAAIAANRAPWYEKTELLVMSVLFFPLLFVGILSSRKISKRGKLSATIVLLAMAAYSQVPAFQEQRRIRDSEEAQAQQAEKTKRDAEAVERFRATPTGKAQLAAVNARLAAENKLHAAIEKRRTIAKEQEEARKERSELASTSVETLHTDDGIVHLGADWPFSETSGIVRRVSYQGDDDVRIFESDESEKTIALNGVAGMYAKADRSLGYIMPEDSGIWIAEKGGGYKTIGPLIEIAGKLSPEGYQRVAR